MFAELGGRGGPRGPCPYPHWRRLVALRGAACSSARVPRFVAPLRRVALHPRGVGTARGPLWGKRQHGAALCARGGTPTGWWTPWVFR